MLVYILIVAMSYILGIISLYFYESFIKIKKHKKSHLLEKEKFIKNFNYGEEFSNKEKK